MEQTASGHGGAAKIKQRAPGLDGVRALAVLVVMAFHEGIRGMPGGFLGVDVFFVLSGYLITDLLVAQRTRRRGRLDLRGFWTRRARRLLPALAVVLVTVTAAVAVIEPGQLGALRPALAAAVTYSSNWYEAYHHVSYFAAFGPPPPLQHLWSLAIEEQFYLAWPLILGLVLLLAETRRARASVAWLGAAASALLMALLYTPGADPSRVYYGTDTHATALLVGSAIALTWPLAKMTAASGELTRRLDFVGMAGLAALAWAVGHFSGADAAVYPAGLVIAALAAAGLTRAAAAPGTIGGLLSLPPLRWLGVRSYGIYLWHWPVIAIAVALTGQRTGNVWLWIIEAAAAIGLAAASWRWIETPILRNGFFATFRTCQRALTQSARSARRSPMQAMPVVATVAVATVACTAGYGVLHASSNGISGLMRQVAQGERISAATRSLKTRAKAPGPARPDPGTHARRDPGAQSQRPRIPEGPRGAGDGDRGLGHARRRGPAPRRPARHLHRRAGEPADVRGPAGDPAPGDGRLAAPGGDRGAGHQRPRDPGPDPPANGGDRAPPQARPGQHVRGAALGARGQRPDRRRRPRPPQRRAGQLAGHDHSPHRSAVGRRGASPPTRRPPVREGGGGRGPGRSLRPGRPPGADAHRPGRVTAAGRLVWRRARPARSAG